MNTEFDPLDLAMLACAIGASAGDSFRRSQGDAEEMVEVAKMLDRLWLELDRDNWGAVFVYEVTEPLGVAIGERIAAGESIESLREFAEQKARELIADAE